MDAACHAHTHAHSCVCAHRHVGTRTLAPSFVSEAESAHCVFAPVCCHMCDHVFVARQHSLHFARSQILQPTHSAKVSAPHLTTASAPQAATTTCSCPELITHPDAHGSISASRDNHRCTQWSEKIRGGGRCAEICENALACVCLCICAPTHMHMHTHTGTLPLPLFISSRTLDHELTSVLVPRML